MSFLVDLDDPNAAACSLVGESAGIMINNGMPLRSIGAPPSQVHFTDGRMVEFAVIASLGPLEPHGFPTDMSFNASLLLYSSMAKKIVCE